LRFFFSDWSGRLTSSASSSKKRLWFCTKCSENHSVNTCT
jgi:hypothetical protein